MEYKVPWLKIAFGAFFVLLLVYALGFLATGGNLAIYRFWAPKMANAQNQVFHHTQAFVDGKNTYIVRLCNEATQAEGAQKVALNSEIQQEASTIDPTELNPAAQACVSQAKGF
jgi:hypothetical protein